MAWNGGAALHLDNKPRTQMFTEHGGAGGDDEKFNAFFDGMVSALGDPGTSMIGIPEKQAQAGGDENLEDRVAALEAKLVALENSKAGGGKSCFDCCSYHIGGNHPSGSADGADEAALTQAKSDANLLGRCNSACNGAKANWSLGILKCCHGNTNGQC